VKRCLLILTCLALFLTTCTSTSWGKPTIAPPATSTFVPSQIPSTIPAAPTVIVPRIVRGSPACFERSEVDVIVQNPSFEEGDNLPLYWNKSFETSYTFARETDVAKDGSASAYIKGGENAPIGYPNFSQTFSRANLTGGLRFSARVRTRGVSGGWGAYLSLLFLDQNHNRISEQTSNESAAGDADWKYLTATGDIPDGTKFISLGIILNSHGEAWFDSVSLTQIQHQLTGNDPSGMAVMALTNETLQKQFFGFGIQNDPYLYNYDINPDVTNQDIDLVETRISQLQPKLVRVFFDASWLDKPHDSPEVNALARTLQLYEGIGSDINLTMQAWGIVGPDNLTEDDYLALVPKIVSLLEYVIGKQGMTHIRYLTLVNEPDYEFDPPRSAYVHLYQNMSLALRKAGLSVSLVGVDEGNSLDLFWEMVPQLMPFVDVFSYHEYGVKNGNIVFIERIREHLEYMTSSGGGKPLFVWEVGITGENTDSPFTPGEIAPGVLITESYEPMLGFAQDLLYGMYQGIAGFSYFEAYDMYYGTDLKMTFGLWAYKDEGWRMRPFYYMYGLLTRLTQSGAAVVEVGALSCDQALPAIAVQNPDGTQTIYVINPSQRDVTLRLTGLPTNWKPKRYLITETIVADLIQQNALFPDGADYTISSGQLSDQLPPLSMVAYSDAP
jgi:hypothetical protein